MLLKELCLGWSLAWSEIDSVQRVPAPDRVTALYGYTCQIWILMRPKTASVRQGGTFLRNWEPDRGRKPKGGTADLMAV